MTALTLQSVRKRFGRTETLHGIDLHIGEGEFVVFVGPSGCGKSTLLRLIAGLEAVSEGRILFGERDLTRASPSERRVAMVFQSYALYPHMTVQQNLSFGMRMRGEPREAIDRKLEHAVRVLQLEPYLARKPGELSGGQCQRVAIGRALVQEPAVFLFDEPLSNLDAELRLRMRVEIAALHETLRRTMVYVTHDQVEAMTLADRIVVLRDGRIEQVGTPRALYDQPANLFVAGFIGSPAMNLMPAEFEAAGTRLADASVLPSPAGRTGLGHLGVRPEHLRPQADGPLRLEVKVVEELGATRYVHGRCAGQPLCAEWREGAAPEPGTVVRLAPTVVHAFDAAGQRLG
jgi:ABC-type sugar transport system ATPase subunit